MQVKVDKRYLKAKKKPKLEVSTNLNIKEEGNTNGGANGQSSSSCSSGDDDSINGSSCLSPKGPSALNSNGKTRARRGSATDPQSLYARVISLPILSCLGWQHFHLFFSYF